MCIQQELEIHITKKILEVLAPHMHYQTLTNITCVDQWRYAVQLPNTHTPRFKTGCKYLRLDSYTICKYLEFATSFVYYL